MSRRSILAVALAVAWRVLHNFFRNPALFLPSLIFPLFFFTAFAGGLSRVSDLPGFEFPPGYTAFQFVFVLLQSAAFGGVFTGFGIARDFENGFARRLLLAAPHRTGIVLGYALAALGRWLVTATVLTVVAVAAGLQVGGNGVDLFGLFLLALILAVAAVLWATGVAMRVRSMQAGPLMQMPIFILMFLAPVYVPLALIAGWVHEVAKLNPMTAILEASRGFIAGEPTKVALTAACLAVLFALAAYWARGGLRSAEAAG